MRTINNRRNSKRYLFYASCLRRYDTPISSNFPCFEHLFIVPKMFEPLKFGFIIIGVLSVPFKVSGSTFKGSYCAISFLPTVPLGNNSERRKSAPL